MIARTYRFLGLDDSFVPEEIDKPVNVQRQVTESISDDTRELLREILVDDVRRLARLFPEAIDLSLWPGFDNSPAA